MRRKFLWAAMISVAVGLITALLFAIPLMEQVYLDETADQLKTTLNLYLAFVDPADSSGTNAQQTMQRIARDTQKLGKPLVFAVYDLDGNVLADSRAETAHSAANPLPKELQAARDTGEGQAVRTEAKKEGRCLFYAVKAKNTAGQQVLYRVSVPLSGTPRMNALLWSCGLIGVACGLVIAVILARYVIGRMTEPLQQLTDAARAVSDQCLDVRVPDLDGEWGKLAQAFNFMSERLERAHEKLAKSNERMRGILQAMDHGVVAVDNGGMITILTDCTRKLLGNCPVTAERLEECGGFYVKLESLLARAAETDESFQTTAVIPAGTEQRILLIYVTSMSGVERGGALAVISDITRMRKLETMRQEFVGNVTHEFKTPLTSIRGYIELLKSEKRDEKTTRSFYEIIEIEADRLQKLTDDLLQLSEIENGSAEPAPLCPVEETVQRIARTLQPDLQRQQVTLTVNVEPGLAIAMPARRLYQLLKNLMENAVKYNRPGGTVTLTAKKEGTKLRFCVEDTGIGIPAEATDRIFERFYRVDKGRSREQGGTGLGLSIVKHIVSLYGGTMNVDSHLNEGSRFTVTFSA